MWNDYLPSAMYEDDDLTQLTEDNHKLLLIHQDCRWIDFVKWCEVWSIETSKLETVHWTDLEVYWSCFCAGFNSFDPLRDL